jgi:hypothetical protein
MMKRDRSPGERTFDSIRDKYDSHSETAPRLRPGRPTYSTGSFDMEGMVKTIGMAAGFGIGLLLLILAAVSAYAASGWAEMGRPSAMIGYALTAVFLVVAGLGGIAATYNHIFRVLDPNRPPSHGHH